MSSSFVGVSNISDLERGGRLTNLFVEKEESSSGLMELLFGGAIDGVLTISRAGVETSFAGVESISLVFAGRSSSFLMVTLPAILMGVERSGNVEERIGEAKFSR